MKVFSKIIYLSVFSLVRPAISFASLPSAYASLVDTSQNQTFESEPTNFIKLAAVHFITNDNSLNFGNQEFLPADLCKQGGYTHNGCPSGYLKGEECPYDSKYVKECISPDSWCKSHGYTVTSCSVPNYPANPCPYLSTLYKSCEVDNIRACKEAGYLLTCEAGKIGDTAQTCPYNSSYKKCICNPCSGYDYTAAQASAQGYTPGEVCNSCGTIKYKRKDNTCSGFYDCDDGPVAWAKVCYSGSIKKFSECKEVCSSKYQYNSSNCRGQGILSGDSCGGNYDKCLFPAKILFGDGTVSTNILSGKTPVGIVFDESKRLAVALVDINEAGQPGHVTRMWGGNVNVPLESCAWADNDNYFSQEGFAICGNDGRKNTDVLLADANAEYFYAAQSVNKFEPSGCTASFCRKNKWFLPSMNELWKLQSIWMEVNLSLDMAKEWGVMKFGTDTRGHWSSTKVDDITIGGMYIYGSYDFGNHAGNKTFYYIDYVRPVVKY